MYPFERFMKHLKRKAKNPARVEGSIVAGSLTEETSHFTSYYFSTNVRTRSRAPRRYDDGGEGRSYADVNVPIIFSQVGRLSGKLKERWWESDEDSHNAHTYILYNCGYTQHYESVFTTQAQEVFPDATLDELNELKDRDFAGWLKMQVHYNDPSHPQWFRDLVQGPKARITTAHMYFCKGYAFHTYARGEHRATANYGVAVRGESDFYGVLTDIIEVEYPGIENLKCVLFKCEWFDPVIGRGVRTSKFGVVDVNVGRRYNKFEPFILASQAEQVCFIPYPRLRLSGPSWSAVIKVTPRGQVVYGNELPLQQERCDHFATPDQPSGQVCLLNPDNQQLEDPDDNSEEEESAEEESTSDDEEETQV